MRVKLDYLDNDTVLGHKIRCEILAHALRARGHEIVDRNPHWLVADYPTDFTAREHTAPGSAQRLVMGQLPQEPEDWAWHPLHMPHPRTLTGKEYLIIDPAIAKLENIGIRNSLLISMGGYDSYKLTERLLAENKTIVSTVVVGPNFGRAIENPNTRTVIAPTHGAMLKLLSEHNYVICGWGQTTFEALALDCNVVAVVQSNEHADEASLLGAPYVTRSNLNKVWYELEKSNQVNVELDLLGVQRVVDFMQEHCQY